MPGFNIDEFIANVSERGTQKTTKFRVWFALPSCFTGDPNQAAYSSLVQDVPLWSDSAPVPGITQQTLKFKRYGYGPLDTAIVGSIFDDAAIRFMSDGEGDFWSFFHAWVNKTQSKDSAGGMASERETSNGTPLGAYETAWQSSYQVSVMVSLYRDDGTEVQRVVLTQAYPTAVSDIKMDWGDSGDVARFVVNFAYQDWYNVPAPTS